MPLTSPYATNNILVRKKNLLNGASGGTRMTSNFRALNSVTRDMAYPIEDLKSIVRWLATKKVFSVADLRSGYFNCRLRKNDQHLTVVRTVLGLYEYSIMAMSLK